MIPRSGNTKNNNNKKNLSYLFIYYFLFGEFLWQMEENSYLNNFKVYN